MKNEIHPDVGIISNNLENLSKGNKSLEDYLDIAFSFNCENTTITPLQKRNEIFTLLQILSQNNPKNILEIGTANGGTLFLLCKIAPENAKIISIDLPEGAFGGKMYPNWKIPFYETFASKNQKIYLLRSNSHDEQTKTKCKEILENELLDFLLIDGDHTYEGVKTDFEMYIPFVREGGIIAFHDVSHGPKENVGGVGKFWSEIKEKYNGIEIIDNTNSEGYGIGLILISKEKNVEKNQQILQIIYKNQKRIITELQNHLKNSRFEFMQHPLTALLTLYSERHDLQQAFPEVSNGQLHNISKWAKEVNSGKIKEEILSRQALTKFSDWYEKYSKNITKEIQEKTNLENLQIQSKDKINSLTTERTNLVKSNEHLEQERTNLVKSNEHLEQERIHLTNTIVNLNSKVVNLDEQIIQNQTTINSLTFDITQYQKELDLIKSSFGFKTIRFFGSKIDKISRKKKILKDIEATISASKTTIKQEGVSAFANHAKDKIKRGELLLHSQSYNSTSLQLSDKTPNKSFEFLDPIQNIEPTFSASVIIPTNSGESQIKHLIDNINSQVGFKNLKIILVNSGTDPLQNLIQFTNITILKIKPEEFSHGKVRNLGMGQAQGDFIFFMSDDALLTSKHIFFDMCKVFSQDEKIAATSVRQIPKSDSDLMAIYSLNEYYQSLDLSE
ncbi:MAG TPA: CmcI family methyltransferase, partial [Candidatus Paceibacterota bacterium]|nr:CmcI family methyltransferase [Candidatus Paceibacterota bacterium]